MRRIKMFAVLALGMFAAACGETIVIPPSSTSTSTSTSGGGDGNGGNGGNNACTRNNPCNGIAISFSPADTTVFLGNDWVAHGTVTFPVSGLDTSLVVTPSGCLDGITITTATTSIANQWSYVVRSKTIQTGRCSIAISPRANLGLSVNLLLTVSQVIIVTPVDSTVTAPATWLAFFGGANAVCTSAPFKPLTPTNPAGLALVYSSSNTTVLQVNPTTGVATPVAVGTATYRAALAYNPGRYAETVVTVQQCTDNNGGGGGTTTTYRVAPTSISLTCAGTASTMQILAYTKVNGVEQQVSATYTISGGGYFTVAANGVVTAVSAGTIGYVIVRFPDGHTEQIGVIVSCPSQPTHTYTFTPSVTLTYCGTGTAPTYQLEYRYDGAVVPATYTANGDYFTVSSTGVVTAVRAGSGGTVIGTAQGVPKTAQITVLCNTNTTITLSPVNDGPIPNGANCVNWQQQLHWAVTQLQNGVQNTNVSQGAFFSQNTSSFISVDGNGMVRPVANGVSGSTQVTAKAAVDQTATSTITVTLDGTKACGNTSQPVTVGITPSSGSLNVGQTQQLTATIAGTDDKRLTWTSSNTAIATVSSTGLVTAVAAGPVDITATSPIAAATPGVAHFTVNAAPQVTPTVTINGSSTMLLGGTQTFTATFNPQQNNGLVYWESSAPEILYVDNQTGAARASTGRTGTVTIKAVSRANALWTATMSVTVRAP